MKLFGRPLALLAAALAVSSPSFAQFTIGYYDSSRESYGLSGGGPYLSQAKQFLIDKGYTLVSTNLVDTTFLSHVDAFYTGLINSVSAAEVSALHNFVDTQGGFLFIQQDYEGGPWHAPANAILNTFGIQTGGNYGDDTGHHTVGSSEWVTTPNAVTGFIGAAHSVVTSSPINFQTLAVDDANRPILGVFDAGAGRSSDILIATDINFFDNSVGWTDTRNQKLWENIWNAAAVQTVPVANGVPDAGSTLLLIGSALVGIISFRRKFAA